MPSNRMKGNLLGLEINGVFVSCELSCELTFEAELRGASPQDAGRWKEWIAGVRTWSINLNAAMLLQAVGASSGTVLAAFISGEKMRVRFMSKNLLISDFTLGGNVHVQNGTISSAAGAKAGWNTSLMGDGPLIVGNPTLYNAQYGYRLADPYGDEANLVPQFIKQFDQGSPSISLDFSKPSSGNYLFAIIPHGEPIFNIWKNSQFNFGAIPDYVWRPVNTIGDFDYYITWSPIYFTSTIPVVVFAYQNLIPNAFSFTPVVDALLSTLYVSNPQTITGITELVPISIIGSGAEYSINGAAYTALPGYVGPGDIVTVRMLSSGGYSAQTSGVLYVSSVSASFDVTTTAPIGNDSRTADFRRECPTGQVGSLVSYTLNADVYFSDTKEKANILRDQDFDTLGQAYANDPGNGGTCTIATSVSFTMEQDYRRLKLTPNADPIACDINLNVTYHVEYGGGGSSPSSSRTIYLAAGEYFAYNSGGNITTLDPADVIVIDSFNFTPQICSGDLVKVNGQGGTP